MNGRRLWIAIAFTLALTCAATEPSWRSRVPEEARNKTNPYAGDQQAIAAGSKLFERHCFSCHALEVDHKKKGPSMRGPHIQGATEGEIFWMLRNGNRRRGMPSWSSLPEQTRWQIITYIRSLGRDDTAGLPVKSQEEK